MPTNLFDLLDQVIAPELIVPVDAQNRLVLTEEQNSGRDGFGEKVYMKKRGRVYAFSLDQRGMDVFPFFRNTTPGINKKNDAVLICQNGNDCYVLIIELKSGNPKDGIIQLKSGRNFVEYLLSTINLHYDVTMNVEYRNIIFNTKRSASKRPTRRLRRESESIAGMDVYLEKCNQVYAVDEFF